MTPPTTLRFGTCPIQRKHPEIVTDRRGHDPALRSVKQQFTGLLTKADMDILFAQNRIKSEKSEILFLFRNFDAEN